MSNIVPIKLARPDKCAECKTDLVAGTKAYYEIQSHLNGGRKVYCEDCGKELND